MQDMIDKALQDLWALGLSPTHYNTLPKAVAGVCGLVALLREQLDNPPADVVEFVLQREKERAAQ